MHRFSVRFPSIVPSLIALLLTLTLAAGVQAQRGKDLGPELPKEEGTDYLEKEFKKKTVREPFDSLVSGREQLDPKDKVHTHAVDIMAQWFAFRLTWTDYQEPASKSSKTIRSVHEDFDRRMNTARDTKEDNKKFLALFTQRMIIRLKEVLDKGNIRAKVSAGVMMQRLAQTGRQELIKDMIGILQKKKPAYPDYVKLYAIKSLKELFERQPPLPAAPAARKAREDAYATAVKELIKYVEHAPTFSADATPAEKQRIVDVFRYFRREAIRALAQSRLPAVAYDKADKKVVAPVAYWLLRVVTDELGNADEKKARDPEEEKKAALKEGNLYPPPSLSEKVAAATGLCLLRSGPDSPYQPDLALYAVARFIHKELASEYNNDWNRIVNVEAVETKKGKKKKERSKEAKPIRAEPWKIHGTCLEFGLVEMETSTAGTGVNKAVSRVKKEAGTILRAMQVFPSNKNSSATEGQLKVLQKVIDGIKPKGASPYKGYDDLQIKKIKDNDE